MSVNVHINQQSLLCVGSVRRGSRPAGWEGEGDWRRVTSSDEKSFGGRAGEAANPARCY